LKNSSGSILRKGRQSKSVLYPHDDFKHGSGTNCHTVWSQGFNECVVTACATSANAIGDAFKVIQRGDADVIITGDRKLHNTVVFCRFLLDESHDHNGRSCFGLQTVRCRKKRICYGEGAAILVLEELEHALKRGANILAEIVGYGVTNDAYHITAPAPEGEGAARCMKWL